MSITPTSLSADTNSALPPLSSSDLSVSDQRAQDVAREALESLPTERSSLLHNNTIEEGCCISCLNDVSRDPMCSCIVFISSAVLIGALVIIGVNWAFPVNNSQPD